MNLSELLFDPDKAGDEHLVHAGGRDASRGEIQARALQVVEALASADVALGEPVGVMLGDGIDVMGAMFGVWRAGAVYVPLNPRLSDDEIAHVFDMVHPAAIITTPEHAGRFDEVAIVLTAAEDTATDDPLDLIPGPVGVGEAFGPDVALIQFTSGTTGKPKPVLLLHDGVLDLIDGVLRKLRSSPAKAASEDEAPKPRVVNLIPVSLSLWAGLYSVLFGMRTGALIVTMDRFDTAEFARLVRRFEIRSTVLPPAAMAMLSDDETITDLAPLRFVRSITAPLSPLQARRFDARFGIGILNCYGQTEVGGEIIGWNAADLRAHGDKLGSIGRPHDGVELRIADAEGNELPGGDDEAGELWVRTPAMSGGYADGGDLSDRLSPDGYFRTGDLARIDPEGFVWIEGRVSDMINRGGMKVFPGDVEEVLRLSPEVVDAAVVGVPDDRLGEVPWAYVVVRGAAPSTDELVALCREHLAPYKVPVRFEVVDDLPRNEVGKVLKNQLVERAAGS